MKISDFIWMVVLTLLVGYGLYSYFSTPVVYWSHSQNKCVRVIQDGVEYDCSNLPDKYERVWVK